MAGSHEKHMPSDGMRSVAVEIAGITDTNNLDAFGRLRVSNPVNLFQNKNIHNRNRNQWEEPIIGAIIEHGAVTGGPFQVAETITGGTSGTIGTVTVVNGGSLTITYTVNHDDFVVGETITGGTSGATATITVIGGGSTITHDRDRAAVILQVGTNSGDNAKRVSHRYISYVPGSSHKITQTFLFGEAVDNIRRRVGYFSDDNGLFFEQTLDGIRFVRRTKTSGTVVDNFIEQSEWSIDKLDGKGPSKEVLDITKVQFFFIDFQWQGTGLVRIGFDIGGRLIDAHHIKSANVLDEVYMSTPSLPVTCEISNTGGTAAVQTMNELCTAVVSEGGDNPSGVGFSISNDTTPRAIAQDTETPFLAIRLLNSFGGGENRKTIQFSNGGVFATGNSAHFEIKHVHDPTEITATWTAIGGGSAVEFSTDITAITGNPAHKIEEGYAGSGQAGKGGTEDVVAGDKLDQHRLATQNTDSTNSEVFVLVGAGIGGVTNLYGHLSWVEFD